MELARLRSSNHPWYSALISFDFQSLSRGGAPLEMAPFLGRSRFPWCESTPWEYSWLSLVPDLSQQSWLTKASRSPFLTGHRAKQTRVLKTIRLDVGKSFQAIKSFLFHRSPGACSSLILDNRLDADCWTQLLFLGTCFCVSAFKRELVCPQMAPNWQRRMGSVASFSLFL